MTMLFFSFFICFHRSIMFSYFFKGKINKNWQSTDWLPFTLHICLSLYVHRSRKRRNPIIDSVLKNINLLHSINIVCECTLLLSFYSFCRHKHWCLHYSIWFIVIPTIFFWLIDARWMKKKNKNQNRRMKTENLLKLFICFPSHLIAI